MTHAVSAQALLDEVLDAGSWLSWDDELPESVRTGEGTLRGRPVAVVVSDFDVDGGSIGVAAATRLVAAVEQATRRRLPLLAAPASGGTRMQEGTIAFLQMVTISAAVTAHKAAGLPYLVYLRNPTTGGVFASWGSLGQVTVAEPGALIGFLGPRVYRALHGEDFPSGVQSAENLMAHGLVDGVLPASELAEITDRFLDVASSRPVAAVLGFEHYEPRHLPAWESIERSRRPDRPGVREILRYTAEQVIPLNGTGEGEAPSCLLLALVRFGLAPAVVLGQDRRRQDEGFALGPADLRVARRGMRLAAELGLPLLSVIDTAGAALSAESESGGLAGEIARCLAELTTLPSPTVCLLLGQGAGGGALALLPADRVLAAEHAWLAPLPPEGAAVILHGSPERAAEVAALQRVRAQDLFEDGVVDGVVPEHPDAADEAEDFCRRVGRRLEQELVAVMTADPGRRAEQRAERYRAIGRR